MREADVPAHPDPVTSPSIEPETTIRPSHAWHLLGNFECVFITEFNVTRPSYVLVLF